jgi:predicted kinase
MEQHQVLNAPQEVLDEIANEYESTLLIPENKLSPQWMLMPVGLIGAGKTTVVRSLAERLNLIRLNTDDVREMLKRRNYSYEGARDVVLSLCKKYLSLGYSLALDANTGSKTGLEYNARSVEGSPHVRQLFVHINPPEEYIVNKLKSYHHTWLFRDSEHAVKSYLENKEAFSLPNLHFVYTFDPSREDLPRQIEEGAELLEAELHKPELSR